jgi:hypothetical protein
VNFKTSDQWQQQQKIGDEHMRKALSAAGGKKKRLLEREHLLNLNDASVMPRTVSTVSSYRFRC